MSQKPLTMEQLKQVLQLKQDGIAIREIARRTGISRNAIKRYLSRLEPLIANGCSIVHGIVKEEICPSVCFVSDNAYDIRVRSANLRHFPHNQKRTLLFMAPATFVQLRRRTIRTRRLASMPEIFRHEWLWWIG